MCIILLSTDETLELVPSISNTNNFSLERDNERPIVLRPHSTIEVPLRFMPSCLGESDHLAKVIFMSQQVRSSFALIKCPLILRQELINVIILLMRIYLVLFFLFQI